MKAFAKVFIILAGLALIGVTVLFLFAFTQFDTFGKGALERALSFAFNAPTTIDSVTYAPTKGIVEFHGLTVSNPKGFKEVPAMTFETVVIEFDYSTLFSQTPTIRKVLLQNGKIDLRYDLGAGSNLSHLAQYASRFSKDKIFTGTGAKEEENGKEKTSAADKSSEGFQLRIARRKFVIQEFRCEGTSITVGTNLLPGAAATMELAPFSLSGLGKDKPLTAGEVTAIFLRSLTKEALSSKSLLGPAAEALRREFSGPAEAPADK